MIHIHGIESFQTSVTHDNHYMHNFCKRSGYQLSKPNSSEWEISVWWNTTNINKEKKYIIYISNFVKKDNKNFINKMLHMDSQNPGKIFWICPGNKQKREIKHLNLNTTFNPFYIDDCYYNENQIIDLTFLEKKYLNYNGRVLDSQEFHKILEDKMVAGSFQRDTEGGPLNKPKWQKGPENIISLINNSSHKKDIVLLLCGPRRHYITQECINNNINFLYVGNRPTIGDDISYNVINQFETLQLYNLLDFYICGSVLEGGPKCIIESAHLNVPIFSHDIGLARDYISDNHIYSDFSGESLDEFISNLDSFKFKSNFFTRQDKDKTLQNIINEN